MINSNLSHNFVEPPAKIAQNKSSRRELFAPEITSQNSISQKGQEAPKPSPTKEDLKSENKLLQQEITHLKTVSNLRKADGKKSEQNKVLVFPEPKIVKCNQSECMKSFVTVSGLDQHMKKAHRETGDYKKSKKQCPFFGKETYYVDQHIKAVHKEMKTNETCEVCKQVVKKDMKKHRSTCIFCPFCEYQNRKKDRLLRHIETNHRENITQTQPMDLTSPRKDIIRQSMSL